MLGVECDVDLLLHSCLTANVRGVGPVGRRAGKHRSCTPQVSSPGMATSAHHHSGILYSRHNCPCCRPTRQPACAAPGPRHGAALLCHCQAPDQQQQDASSSGEAPLTQQPRQPAPSTSGSENSNGGISNGLLAGGAVAAGVLLFAATRLLSAEPTLAALEDTSVPLEQALVNGRPTVMEFYASWCGWISHSGAAALLLGGLPHCSSITCSQMPGFRCPIVTLALHLHKTGGPG